MKPLKVLSLFDGISCGRVALDRANIKVERYVAYEIDDNAIKIAKKNRNHQHILEIKKNLKKKDIMNHKKNPNQILKEFY